MWPFKKKPPKKYYRIRPDEVRDWWIVEKWEGAPYWMWRTAKICNTQEEATEVALKAEERYRRGEVYEI